jgi:hypothetical protein
VSINGFGPTGHIQKFQEPVHINSLFVFIIGTEGVVQYKCELNPEYWLTFNWVNNVWGKKQFTANGPPNFSVNQTGTLTVVML